MSDRQPEYAIRKMMLDHTGLDALGTRIYAMMPPQGTELPYSWVENIQDEPDRHQVAATGLSQALIMVHFAASTYSQLSLLLSELRIALNSTIAQNITYDTGKTVFLHDVTVERLQRIIDGPTDGSDRPIFIGFADINVWYAQAID